MMPISFDLDHLEARLAQLSPSHRVAFCASVCERLVPNYASFTRRSGWGRPDLLREALDEVWRVAAGESVAVDRLRTLRKQCEAVMPDTEDHSDDFTSAALDASAALVETLACCVDGDAHRCAVVGSLARDTVDMYIQARDDLSYDDPRFEERIRLDDLMQRELQRQEGDLRSLEGASKVDTALLGKLRLARSNIDVV